MRLDFLTLAENVAISERKLYIHGGALSVMRVPQLPWFAELAIGGRFEADEDERGNSHTFSIAVVEPDGDALFPMQPMSLTLGDPHRVADGWDLLQVLVSLKIKPLALRETGWYTVDVGLDGESVAQLSLLVELQLPPGLEPAP
jgi:hypothetical protein